MSEAVGSDLKGVIGCESTRSDSAVKLVSCYVPRGEVRRPFSYFVPSRRVILDNKPFTLNEACVAKHHGAPKDDESIKHSDVLVEDQEKIKKHAKKLEKKEPVELEKKTRN